jgi:glycine cleavage system H protein
MIPENLHYHTEHEWIRVEQDTAVLGITDFAQDSLGDIVYLELPKVNAQFKAGEEIGEVESTKTTSPVYTPVSGIVKAVNEELRERPELVNKDPYNQGWIVKIQMSHPGELGRLMTAKQYEEFLKKENE